MPPITGDSRRSASWNLSSISVQIWVTVFTHVVQRRVFERTKSQHLALAMGLLFGTRSSQVVSPFGALQLNCILQLLQTFLELCVTASFLCLLNSGNPSLVGGFNTSEKHSSIGMIIPNIWENKKCSKPPTSSGLMDLTLQLDQNEIMGEIRPSTEVTPCPFPQ